MFCVFLLVFNTCVLCGPALSGDRHGHRLREQESIRALQWVAAQMGRMDALLIGQSHTVPNSHGEYHH